MTLAETQRDLCAWLQAEAPDAAWRLGARAAPGLKIYLNTYRAQLVGCLEQSFARTREWIGDAAFHEAVIRHIGRVPPSSWTLDAYPRDFPDTLRLLYPADPEIVELAVLESALDDAFVGPDTDPVAAAIIAAVDWDRAVLHFCPTLDLHPATTNAAAIWTALTADEMPPQAVALLTPGALLVWRQAMVSRFRTIDAAEHHALLLARAGMPFAALCAILVETHGEHDGVALAAAYLGRWLSDELLIDITQGENRCEPSQP